MKDQETDSEWSHILGEAMAGPLKGTNLEVIPSSMTDWETWKRTHPQTIAILLERTAHVFVKDYHVRDKQYFVLGISNGDDAKAWDYDLLAEQKLTNDAFRDNPVLLYYDAASETPFIYSRSTKIGELKFHLDTAEVTDDKGNLWNLVSGVAVSGPNEGQTLERLPGIPSYRGAWKVFYPNSEFGK